jgi:O-acetyl-ADP-ribose deacetylase (regulator of RNase III)
MRLSVINRVPNYLPFDRARLTEFPQNGRHCYHSRLLQGAGGEVSNSSSFLDGRVIVETGDITLQTVDAIVNAANSSLLGGGGVDGAIHYRGGPAILEECREIRRTRYPQGLPTGEAVITSGGKLPAKYVIHTVGPIYGRISGRGRELAAAELTACYANSLALAVQNEIGSIAFPAISTGAFGYPPDEAAAVASLATKSFLNSDTNIREVRLVFYGEGDKRIFLQNHKF